MQDRPYKSYSTLMKVPFHFQTPYRLDDIRSVKIPNSAKIPVTYLVAQGFVTIAKFRPFVMTSKIFSLAKKRVSVLQATIVKFRTLDSLGNFLDRIMMSFAKA